MAKQDLNKKALLAAQRNGHHEDQEESSIYTTRGGKVITLKSISPLLLDKIRGSVELPDRPYYEARTAAGNVEKHYHDETTLETDEDRETWDKYQADLAAAQQVVNERIMRALFLRGVDVGEPDEDWVEEQEFLGLSVPESRSERKVHYVMTEVITSPEDMVGIMTQIMRLTGVDEEVIAAAEDSFRRSMERRGRDAVKELENQAG